MLLRWHNQLRGSYLKWCPYLTWGSLCSIQQYGNPFRASQWSAFSVALSLWPYDDRCEYEEAEVTRSYVRAMFFLTRQLFDAQSGTNWCVVVKELRVVLAQVSLFFSHTHRSKRRRMSLYLCSYTTWPCGQNFDDRCPKYRRISFKTFVLRSLVSKSPDSSI